MRFGTSRSGGHADVYIERSGNPNGDERGPSPRRAARGSIPQPASRRDERAGGGGGVREGSPYLTLSYQVVKHSTL